MMELLTDTVIDGRDVAIYEDMEGVIALDIKHPCGELIKGWCDLENHYEAVRLANLYVYALGEPTKAHCDNEYCQESYSDKTFIYSVGW